MPTRLLTISEVADVLSCSKSTVRRLAERRVLPRIQVSQRSIRFDAADVEAFLARSRTAT